MALPGADVAADEAAESELERVEQLWYDLELPDGIRLELISGELVVTPTPAAGHSRAVFYLIKALMDAVDRRGWIIHTNLAAHISPTRERLIPDLMVAPPGAPLFTKSEMLSPGILLAAEVVSPSSQRRDRVDKRRAYARGSLPLYLLIDPFARPAAVTLLSEPGPDDYAREQTAAAGQPLRLPEPFGADLDTARLLQLS
jgi:Uma2 family endonuclease